MLASSELFQVLNWSWNITPTLHCWQLSHDRHLKLCPVPPIFVGPRLGGLVVKMGEDCWEQERSIQHQIHIKFISNSHQSNRVFEHLQLFKNNMSVESRRFSWNYQKNPSEFLQELTSTAAIDDIRRCWTIRSPPAWNACSRNCWPPWPRPTAAGLKISVFFLGWKNGTWTSFGMKHDESWWIMMNLMGFWRNVWELQAEPKWETARHMDDWKRKKETRGYRRLFEGWLLKWQGKTHVLKDHQKICQHLKLDVCTKLAVLWSHRKIVWRPWWQRWFFNISFSRSTSQIKTNKKPLCLHVFDNFFSWFLSETPKPADLPENYPRYLAENADALVLGKSFVELGSGTGFVGMSCALLGAKADGPIFVVFVFFFFFVLTELVVLLLFSIVDQGKITCLITFLGSGLFCFEVSFKPNPIRTKKTDTTFGYMLACGSQDTV